MENRARPAEANIRGIISDLDGVVYRGETLIPDAAAAFSAWRRQGIPYAFVTNNSTKSAAQFAAKLDRMGVSAIPAQIFTAISATVSLMRRRWPAGARIFAIGEKPLLDALTESGFELAGEQAEVVILGFDHQLTYAKLRTAVRAALGGATVVVANPDVLVPSDDGFEPCVGAILAAVTAAVPSVVQIIAGKPEPHMIEDALTYIRVARDDTIMIGDQIATDIAAGQKAGLRSILVATGVPQQPLPEIVPYQIVATLLDLLE
jgi:HAD superfamily hydrolase (TIGR01450 family)